MRRDPYEVLGVSRDAEDGHIKRTFRKLARELHPDVNRHDPEAEEKFKEAAEAYEILSDPGKRERYDLYGRAGPEAFPFADISEMRPLPYAEPSLVFIQCYPDGDTTCVAGWFYYRSDAAGEFIRPQLHQS